MTDLDLKGSYFIYCGEYDKSKEYIIGDIINKNGVPYVYTRNTWEMIDCSITDSSINNSNYPAMKFIPKICPQCGAPFHGNKCAYCNTEFYFAGDK